MSCSIGICLNCAVYLRAPELALKLGGGAGFRFPRFAGVACPANLGRSVGAMLKANPVGRPFRYPQAIGLCNLRFDVGLGTGLRSSTRLGLGCSLSARFWRTQPEEGNKRYGQNYEESIRPVHGAVFCKRQTSLGLYRFQLDRALANTNWPLI